MYQTLQGVIIAIIIVLTSHSVGFAQAEPLTADALFEQGKAYHDGTGVTQDFDAARRLYQRAAEQGSTDAALNLGYLYFVGEGMARDFVTARTWYERAANAGDENAAQNLAYMDAEGLGLAPIKPSIKKPVIQTAAQRIVKLQATALPEPAAIMGDRAYLAPLHPQPGRDYATITAGVAEALTAIPIPDTLPPTPPTPSTRSPGYSPLTVFSAIIMIAALLSGLLAWIMDRRVARARQDAAELARLFFEHNRRLLREIYVRYPDGMRDIGARELGWAVAISVLIVRYVLFRKAGGDADEAPVPARLARSIIFNVTAHPAKARHIAYVTVPEVLRLVQSDIRAFDKEHITARETPPIYKSARKKPRKLSWTPRLVTAS